MKLGRLIKNSYLCIKYPFLYPRNRFSGKHYTNWSLLNKRNDIFKKWSDYANNRKEEYYKKYGFNSLFIIGEEPNFKFDEGTLKKVFVKSDYVLKLAPWSDRFKYWLYGFLNDFLGIFHFLPTYTELDTMDNGWRKTFGIQICEEIKQALLRINKKALRSYHIYDIKEKWGMLRWDSDFGSTEVQKIIAKYEYISARTCVICGKPATGYTPIESWKSPYCDDCKPETSKFFIEFGTTLDDEQHADSWYGYTGDVNVRRDKYEDVKKNFKEYLEIRC